MRTVPLCGKSAAGRVAFVDNEDYDLVMQYKWYVRESRRKGRPHGPYASAPVFDGGRQKNVLMHVLIMGQRGIDHKNHNGLDNQRHNLRAATGSQNNQNQLPQQGRSSQYKGVWFFRKSGLWYADIKLNGRRRSLGRYVCELEAAYAYDAAARELFGEFACPNFPDEPTQAMRDQWRAETEARRIAVAAKAQEVRLASVSEWWAQQEARVGVCVICGSEYLYRSQRKSFYCGNTCRCRAKKIRDAARRSEAERDGRLF